MIWMVWVLTSVPTFAADPELPPAVTTERLSTGQLQVTPDRQKPRDASDASNLRMDFGSTNLFDLTLYFADLLRKNFLITDDEALRKKELRLIGHSAMTVDEAWQAYRSALQGHGFTTIEVGAMITVVPIESAARGPVPVGRGVVGGEGVVTRILPLVNARASDLSAVVRPLLSSSAQLTAYAPANTLIVTDTASNVRKIHTLVAELDVAAPTSSLKLLRLQWATAADVKRVLEALYPVAPAEVATPTPRTRPQRRRNPRSPSSASAPAATAGSEARHISTILDDERTNSLIVLANPQGHAAVAAVVSQLDVDVDPSSQRTLHVVQLKYAVAEEVAAVLAELQSSAGSSSTQARRNTRARGEQAQPRADVADALDSDLRIAADPATNALAVVADPREFAAVSALIAELDVARGQVFVDAVFVELTQSDGSELSLGAHVLPSDDIPGAASIQADSKGQPVSLASTADFLSGLAAGVFGPFVDVLVGDTLQSVPLFGIALRALQTASNVNVMGNPALLALDHHEASLSVGRKVPFPTTSQSSVLGAVPFTTYERVDVAMTLDVTPHINSEDLVTLDVELTVDEVEPASAETDLEGGPVTTGRNVQSRVMVEDGQTVVIAGVASVSETVLRSKVPILGDIPLLGALFRSKSKDVRRSNLMVFLTPHIVNSPADVLRIRRMKEAQRAEFVRRFHGKEGGDWLTELQGLLADARDPS
ncbi:MAG: type II secretion system secretin GspD [Myxococcales bacterium]|nr:type II secretion system secretin GspD [Myxococcales bacterium]